MSSRDEHNTTPFPKPIEIKLADVLFLALRKHLMVFKDLTASRYAHYTMVMNGSLIEFHKTLESLICQSDQLRERVVWVSNTSPSP